MAITIAQLNAGKAVVLDRLFQRYPMLHGYALRVLVQSYKQAANQTQRDIAMAIANQAYQTVFGVAPSTRQHHFRQWLRDQMQIPLGAEDLTTGVDPTDCPEQLEVPVT